MHLSSINGEIRKLEQWRRSLVERRRRLEKLESAVEEIRTDLANDEAAWAAAQARVVERASGETKD